MFFQPCATDTSLPQKPQSGLDLSAWLRQMGEQQEDYGEEDDAA